MTLLRLLSTSVLFTRPVQRSAAFVSRYFASHARAPETLTDCWHHRHYKQVILNDRTIIKLTGADRASYLQSLITNDVKLLLDNEYSQQCLYSFLLHSNGRILADLFIYNFPQRSDEFLLEVDSNIAENFLKLLKHYRIRKKVKVNIEENCSLIAIFPESPGSAQNLPLENLTNQNENNFIVSDPRSHHFGYRMICMKDNTSDSTPNLSSILTHQNEAFNSVTIQPSDRFEYRKFLYQLGIGEGEIDFPWELVFPFEANAELLNAVSFAKGCYIGQELVARTYHTGVIRKRFVPIEFDKVDDSNPIEMYSCQNVILQEADGSPPRVMGRFRGNQGKYGIASLKYGEIFGKTGEEEEGSSSDGDKPLPSTKWKGVLKLANDGHTLYAKRPFWWPETL